ncbi:hypothetical protein Tsubulata_033671 [Turnera subulata]|uniref:Wall-associated receptor kinase galacturonan-binding domain-containing protein n=1 Tax=Turnera subulata TaxID=218843 RepID=A0A9Q0JI45_9ROSI|nr:hypothetical protein Tsubulata_033671 [Turnera subulata]
MKSAEDHLTVDRVVRNISYPFWGRNQSRHCGHPAFELTCQENQYPIIVSEDPDQFRPVDPNRKVMKLEQINPKQYI